jgi:MFS family permease
MLYGSSLSKKEASLTLKQLSIFGILSATILLAIGSFHAASQLVFGSLGRTPADPGWYLTIAVFVSFLVATISLAIGMLTDRNTFISRLSIAISAVISCMWLGFYYGGIIGGKNPQIAIAVAIGGLLVMTFTSLHFQKRLRTIAIVLLGIVSAYALAFQCLAVAVAYLSTERLLWGTIWGIFCMGAIAILVFFINSIVRETTHYRSGNSKFRL